MPKSQSTRAGARRLAAILALAVASLPAWALKAPELLNLGTGDGRRSLPFSFQLSNESAKLVSVKLLSLCSCIVLAREDIILQPGASMTIAGSFDTAGLSGVVERGILAQAAPPGAERVLIKLRVTLPASTSGEACVGCEEVAEQIRTGKFLTGRPELIVEFFSAPGCESCERFLKLSLPKIKKTSSIGFKVALHSAFDPDALDYLTQLLEAQGKRLEAFPILVADGRVIQGAAVYEKEGAIFKKAIESIAKERTRGR